MLIQTFSDLHGRVPPDVDILIHPEVDVVVVAGDMGQGIANSMSAVRRFVPDRIPMVMVAGNHEFYRRSWPDEIDEARRLGPSLNCHFLEGDCEIIGGVRFAGMTFWTDFMLFGGANQKVATDVARSGMNDFRVITWRKNPWKRFRPEEAMLLNFRSRCFLREAMCMKPVLPLVVVTHHAPSTSLRPEERWDVISAAYASDMSAIFDPIRDAPEADAPKAPSLLIHGHLHRTLDYTVGSTRLICNGRGRGSDNPLFAPCKTIEVS